MSSIEFKLCNREEMNRKLIMRDNHFPINSHLHRILLALMVTLVFPGVLSFNLECYLFNDVCTVGNLEVIRSDVTVTTLNEKTADYYFKTEKEITRLSARDQLVKFMPLGIAKFAPNISELSRDNPLRTDNNFTV